MVTTHPTPNANLLVAASSPLASSSELATLRNQLANLENEARDSSALLDLLTRLHAADSVNQACCLLVNELRSYLQCGTLALTMRRGSRSGTSLRAISSLAEFDSKSELAQQFESASDEAILGDRSTMWPPVDASGRHATLALKKLCSQTNADSAICALLRDSAGTIIGTWVILDIAPDATRRTQTLVQAFASPVANCLAAKQRQQRHLIRASWDWLTTHARTRVGWTVAALLGISLAAMFVPATHKITCDCRLEPVMRRFVAAPFEGTLEESLVEPGDVVEQGALLARLDGREIRWKQSELAADRARASKQRDAELAAGKFGAAQISKLEMQRIDLQIKLLKHRADNLEIRSPIAGIVTSGDLERVQGAPVTIGQTLFEIAPLDAMVVEFAIPQDEIRFVRATNPVNIQLDSHAGQTWQLTVDRVQPQAEIRDQENVFVGTALLENGDGQLRPGMEGRARVLNGKRAIGWLLFHKPWDALRTWMGW